MAEKVKCPVPLCTKYASKNRKGFLKHLVEKSMLSDSDIYDADKKIAENHKFICNKLRLNLRVNKSQEQIIEDIKQIKNKCPHQSF